MTDLPDPLVIEIAYLAAAAAGGRRGSYWATACVLVGWGLAVVCVGATKPAGIDPAGAYLVGAGLGAVAGTILARRHFDVNPLGLGATAAAVGLVNLALAFKPTPEPAA